MARLDRFGVNTTDVAEYIPWGGIIRPHIMKQKNHSLLSVIEYKKFSLDLNETKISDLTTWGFRRGWTIWAEHQHQADTEGRDFLCICWNPFLSGGAKGTIINAMIPKLPAEKDIAYFSKQVSKILEDLRQFTDARFLTYQDLMDMLSFTLSYGMNRQEMPEVPLFMDALLTNDIDFRFGENHVYVNKHKIYIVSVLTPEDMTDIYQLLTHVTFRHTRRLLMFSQKEAGKDMKRYTESWFSGRKVLKNVAMKGILKRYNGYYMDAFLFALDDDMENFREYMEDKLNDFGFSYIPEKYFLKEIFWGSIPGMYWAYSKPPLVGFDYLTEFLTGGVVVEQTNNLDILEEAENNLIPTTVNVSEYLSPQSEDNAVEVNL